MHGKWRSGWRADAVERFLDRLVIRLGLSAAIIVSLIPFEWGSRLDTVFLGVFATEFALRLWALIASIWDSRHPEIAGESSEPPPRRTRAIALLLIDLLALISFLPGTGDTEVARWLRVIRLARMLLLVGYWAPLVRDLWAILIHRERARHLALMGLVVGGLSFAGAVVLHHLGGAEVDVTGDGAVDHQDVNFLNLLWWSFRQVQDPGNMLESPIAVPVVAISVGLTVFGLFLVSFLIGLGTDVMHELIELTRMRPPGLRGHTVVVNITASTQRLLHELVRYYHKLLPNDMRLFSLAWFKELFWGVGRPRYVAVGRTAERPEFLQGAELAKIVYREHGEDEELLINRADLLTARRIVILADWTERHPDAETIRALVTLVERMCERDRGRGKHSFEQPQRVLIAEILDEANIAAARSALSTGRDRFHGFVVPTEKLLALFVSAVTRRPGLSRLLDELLTSRGHEIYTHMFGEPVPARAAFDALFAVGLSGTVLTSSVIPIGLLTRNGSDEADFGFDVFLNPRARGSDDGLDAYGFVAVSDTERSIASVGASLHARITDEQLRPLPGSIVPGFRRAKEAVGAKLLLCGFRPGTIYLLEEFVRGADEREILILVGTEAARQETLEALVNHSELVARGLLSGRHGVFVREHDTMRFVDNTGSSVRGSSVRVCVGDWLNARTLLDLPGQFGSVADLDTVVFVARDSPAADASTTTSLLKLEQLLRGRETVPRIVAEVFDRKLATRLQQRYQTLGGFEAEVMSIQELRAYFLFQSVVVPGFDLVYAELLGSWGQSLVRCEVAERCRGPCSFRDLAFALLPRGRVLIALELIDDRGRVQLCVGPGRGELGATFDVERLTGIWVVDRDTVPRED